MPRGKGLPVPRGFERGVAKTGGASETHSFRVLGNLLPPAADRSSATRLVVEAAFALQPLSKRGRESTSSLRRPSSRPRPADFERRSAPDCGLVAGAA